MSRRTRRSYDQFCAVARALDQVGDRWSLLVVRELLAGPRRYTELHADLPGVSTDVLAGRLREMEHGGLVTRRRASRQGAGRAYELTERGYQLLPVLGALADWGTPDLAEQRPTDAVRAHWFALPLLRALQRATHSRHPGVGGVVDVRLEEGVFHLRMDAAAWAEGARGPEQGDGIDAAFGPVYGEGPATPPADVSVELDTEACVQLADGSLTLGAGVRDGTVRVHGAGKLAQALRGDDAAQPDRSRTSAKR